MPVKNDDGSDAEGDMSAAESERSNSTQGQDSSDEEANEVDSDDSSELDAQEIERRRAECLDNLANLERQFQQLREQYYCERMNLIESQLADVRNGRSDEYLQPLKELDKMFRDRVEVAEKLRKYRLTNLENLYCCEEQAAKQNFESEKTLTWDQMHYDLMEKRRRLEEDRHNVDISWADWGTDKRTSKVRGPGRKKAVTVTGPYIVYLLHEKEILEDWTVITKALKRSAAVAAAATATVTI